MQDEEFFRLLMDKWKATTWAENAYWSYEEDEHTELCDIRANQEHAIDGIAKDLYREDADWITAVHGCFPDLMRCLEQAWKERDEADESRDERECRIAELEMENTRLETELLQAHARRLNG